MADFLLEGTREFLSLAGPDPDDIQRDMQDYAEEHSFPIIGPSVGGLLASLAELTDARRVFEFGSGFGYSASWFARGLGTEDTVVLTEIDADELDLARDYLGTDRYPPTFRYEEGDALDIVEAYDGPFDVVLIDHQKHRYVDGFEAVREKIAPGGAVIADNMMRGPMEFADVLAGLRGEDPTDRETRGVVDYMLHLREDPAFESVVLPIGNGVALGTRRQ